MTNHIIADRVGEEFIPQSASRSADTAVEPIVSVAEAEVPCSEAVVQESEAMVASSVVEPMTEQEQAAEDKESSEGANATDDAQRAAPLNSTASAISSTLESFGLPAIDPVVEAQTYDAVRWIPIIGDTYSLGRAAFFALEGDLQEAGICAVSAIPFVGNTLATAKRVKDAKDASGANGGDATKQAAPLPPVYSKIISFFDSFMGPNEDQQQNKQNEENGKEIENQTQAETTSSNEENLESRKVRERRASMNNFGDEDPIAALSLHPHEASEEIAKKISDVHVTPLDEKPMARKLSIPGNSLTSTEKLSGLSTVHVAGAGSVPLILH